MRNAASVSDCGLPTDGFVGRQTRSDISRQPRRRTWPSDRSIARAGPRSCRGATRCRRPGCGSTINFPATTAKIGATTTSTTMNPAAVIPTMPVRVTASAMTPAVGIPVVEIRVVEIRVAAISSRKADGDVLQKSDARGSIPQTARDGICFFDDQNLGKSGGLPAFRDRTASIRGRARGNEQESHPAEGPRWRRGTHPFGSAPSHR